MKTAKPDTKQGPEIDYLWLNLRDLPYFRALLRAVEARAYQQFDLPAPALDVGCGDGHFASVAFERPFEAGIDPWGGPLRQAARTGAYRLALRSYGDCLPFSDQSFACAVSNSVLEHIPDVDSVLREISRVLKPGSPFIFCVPNHNFLPNLSLAGWLERAGLRRLAGSYRRFFNRISRHHHCDPPEVWQARLERAGFSLERWWHYFSPAALHTLEWGHYFGLPSLLARWLFGRWILLPAPWNLALTRRLVQPFYDEPPEHPQGAYTFYLTRRR